MSHEFSEKYGIFDFQARPAVALRIALNDLTLSTVRQVAFVNSHVGDAKGALRSQAESGFATEDRQPNDVSARQPEQSATILSSRLDQSMPTDDSYTPRDIDSSHRKATGDELSAQQPIIDSDALFRGAQELLIQHNDQIYRLRQTRNGKLILNK